MKKSVLSLLAMILIAAGLVAGGSSSAVAMDDPYTGTINTTCKTKAKNPVAQGKKGKLKTLVNAPGTKLKPRGTERVVVKRIGGGFKQVFKSTVKKGKLHKYTTNNLKLKGTYRVVHKFKPKAGSVFQKCRIKKSFRVR